MTQPTDHALNPLPAEREPARTDDREVRFTAASTTPGTWVWLRARGWWRRGVVVRIKRSRKTAIIAFRLKDGRIAAGSYPLKCLRRYDYDPTTDTCAGDRVSQLSHPSLDAARVAGIA